MNALLKSLWQYRHFVATSIRAEFSGRFARSKLGALWMILNPLAQAAIFAVVLSEILKARMPNIEIEGAYAIYLMSGLAAWGLFSEVMTRCTSVFLDYSNTLKKIAFPRLCLPLIVAGSSLLNHALLLGATFIVFAFLGHFPNWAWLSILPGTFLILCFAFGIGIITGLVNVFSRDVAQVLTILLQLWFWFTPIVYVANVLPPQFAPYLRWNPMTWLVSIYQQALLYNHWIDWRSIAPAALLAVSLFIFSFWIFRRASADLVDAL